MRKSEDKLIGGLKPLKREWRDLSREERENRFRHIYLDLNRSPQKYLQVKPIFWIAITMWIFVIIVKIIEWTQ